MLIEVPCVVSLTWKLRDAHGQEIDELAEPVEFLVGGDDLLPKVEEALTGHEAGWSASLHLEPEHAFGDYDADLVFFEPRTLFPDEVEVGMQFDGVPPGATTEGMPEDAIYTVTEVYPEHVVLDGNHPLAGMALNIGSPTLPAAISSSVASRTSSTVRCMRRPMPASGWLPSSTTCSG